MYDVINLTAALKAFDSAGTSADYIAVHDPDHIIEWGDYTAGMFHLMQGRSQIPLCNFERMAL